MSRHITPPEKATDLGHDLEWDPPAALTAVRRWTCKRCTGTVLDNRGHVYGDASEQDCATIRQRWTDLGYGQYLPAVTCDPVEAVSDDSSTWRGRAEAQGFDVPTTEDGTG